MTETERELDLTLGDIHVEIVQLEAKNARLLGLVAQMAQRLLEIEDYARIEGILQVERMANMAIYKAYALTDESTGETD